MFVTLFGVRTENVECLGWYLRLLAIGKLYSVQFILHSIIHLKLFGVMPNCFAALLKFPQANSECLFYGLDTKALYIGYCHSNTQ